MRAWPRGGAPFSGAPFSGALGIIMHTPRAAARGVVVLIESVDPERVAEITAFKSCAARACCTKSSAPPGCRWHPESGISSRASCPSRQSRVR